MQFSTGTPNLVGRARYWANDPSTAANPMFDDTADVKPQLNICYKLVREALRLPNVGYARKISYGDAVADQKYYEMPSDYLGRLQVTISNDGSNLATAAPTAANAVVLTQAAWDVALDSYQTGEFSDIRFYSVVDQHFAILAPPGTEQVGTNSIQIKYEATTIALSAATDEPDIPEPHHDTIALWAGIMLRTSRGLDLGDRQQLLAGLLPMARKSGAERSYDPGHQIPVAGRVRRKGKAIKFGTVSKS